MSIGDWSSDVCSSDLRTRLSLAYLRARKSLVLKAFELSDISSVAQRKALLELSMTSRENVPDAKLRRILEDELRVGALNPKKLAKFVSVLIAFRKEALKNHSADWVSNSVADAIFHLNVLSAVEEHPRIKKGFTSARERVSEVDKTQVRALSQKVFMGAAMKLNPADSEQMRLLSALGRDKLVKLGERNFGLLRSINEAIEKKNIPWLRSLMKEAGLI